MDVNNLKSTNLTPDEKQKAPLIDLEAISKYLSMCPSQLPNLEEPNSNQKAKDNNQQMYEDFLSTCKFIYANTDKILNYVKSNEAPKIKKLKNKKLGRKITLKNNNQLRHVDGKPYKCNECNKSFTFRGDLSKHLISVHQAKSLPYCCMFCGGVFIRSDYLKKHQFRCKLKMERNKNKYLL